MNCQGSGWSWDVLNGSGKVMPRDAEALNRSVTKGKGRAGRSKELSSKGSAS